MSRNSPPKFYAVKRGRVPGIYSSWEECEAQVKKFPNSKHKGFGSEAEANAWLAEGAGRVDGDTQAQDMNLPSSSTSVDRGGGNGQLQKPQRVNEDDDGGLNVEEDEEEVAYCDGACKGNGKRNAVAGIGVWWGKDDPRNLAERCPGARTNNRAELIAVVRALEMASDSKKRLTIKTDSEYAIECIDRCLRKDWRTSSGKLVKNLSVILYVHGLLRRRKRGQQVSPIRIRGQAGIIGNEGAEAEALANEGVGMPEVEEREWDALRKEIEAGNDDGDDNNDDADDDVDNNNDDDDDDGWNGDNITGGGERSRVERVGTQATQGYSSTRRADSRSSSSDVA